jgi:hypothetical protein
MPHLLISSDSLDGFCTERHFLARERLRNKRNSAEKKRRTKARRLLR